MSLASLYLCGYCATFLAGAICQPEQLDWGSRAMVWPFVVAGWIAQAVAVDEEDL